MMSNQWTARKILKELADGDRRRNILAEFWRHAEPQAKILATAHLAKLLHFRDETLRKMAPEKKAELLASRIGVSELDQFLEMALMQYHTHRQNELMGAFLDRWNVPHVNGSIETDDYKAPTREEVASAVRELGSQYDSRDVALYLASAGLLMGEDWREAVTPAVDELSASLGAHSA